MRRSSGAHDRPREARLRPASAHLYPGITPDVWIQASTMSDIVWAARLRRAEGSLAGRILDPAHFEFRYEGSVPDNPELRRRTTDRLSRQGD
jgi:hypothetical protein